MMEVAKKVELFTAGEYADVHVHVHDYGLDRGNKQDSEGDLDYLPFVLPGDQVARSVALVALQGSHFGELDRSRPELQECYECMSGWR